jgi:hypothetical protein
MMATRLRTISGSAATRRAAACSASAFAIAEEISSALVTGNDKISMPSAAAASRVRSTTSWCCAFVGTHSNAILRAEGIISCNSSSRLPATVSLPVVKPVTLLVGRAILWVKPRATGSPISASTMGISRVTSVRARTAGVVAETITSDLPRPACARAGAAVPARDLLREHHKGCCAFQMELPVRAQIHKSAS